MIRSIMRKNERGKAMTLLLILPLIVPAALAGIHAVKIHTLSSDADLPLSRYRETMEQADQKVKVLEVALANQDCTAEWAAFLAKPPPPPTPVAPPEPEPEPVVEVEPEDLRVSVFELALDGIIFRKGRPFAYVNETLVGRGDIVNGCTVVDIDKDTVSFVDEFGNTRSFNIDEELEKRHPGYHRR